MAERAVIVMLLMAIASSAHAEPPDVDLAHTCRPVRLGLEQLQKTLPRVVVTSAHRDRSSEARAWAGNIARKRRWMRILVAAREGPFVGELATIQAWIDAHWKSIRGKPEPIAQHLSEVFATWSDVDMSRLSPHFAGTALDLKKSKRLTRRRLRDLPDIVQVLDEGDHWHVAFRCERPYER